MALRLALVIACLHLVVKAQITLTFVDTTDGTQSQEHQANITLTIPQATTNAIERRCVNEFGKYPHCGSAQLCTAENVSDWWLEHC